MNESPETSVLDRMLDRLSRCLDEESARRVLALGVDPVVQARVGYLAERANEGLLTLEERSEYEACINADDFITTFADEGQADSRPQWPRLMDAATRGLVRRRAGDRCEYCLLRQEQSRLTHHIEHIIAKQHGGPEEPANLAMACHRWM